MDHIKRFGMYLSLLKEKKTRLVCESDSVVGLIQKSLEKFGSRFNNDDGLDVASVIDYNGNVSERFPFLAENN